MEPKSLLRILTAALSIAPGVWAQFSFSPDRSLLRSLNSITDSTSPANGDLNPYGVAFVPHDFPTGPNIAPGDVLVANFNNSTNTQGTGTTIVSIAPNGTQSLFATSSLIGLDTALGVLSHGFVIVGNLPVVNGTPGQGTLQVFDKNGHLVTTINDAKLLDSPWDLTLRDLGATAQVFVSNVLSGTVTRVDITVGTAGVKVDSKTLIGSNYGHAPNSAAVVVGPTGLAYDPCRDVLFVASTADNKIYAIPDAKSRSTSAGTGYVVFADQNVLHGPLGLTLTPDGHLVTANGDAVNPGGTQNDLVEFRQDGSLVTTYQLDGNAPGAAFGIVTAVSHGEIHFAAVDDNLNAVTIWKLRPEF